METYRQYLQRIANDPEHADVLRNQAGALLQVVGDDRKIDENFLASGGSVSYGGQVFGKAAIDALNNNWSGNYAIYLDTAGSGGTTGGGGGTSDAEAQRLAAEAAERTALRNEISGFGGEVDNIYGSLFGSLDNLVRSRDTELETQYGEQFDKASKQYTSAIPEIETSYASLGAADSTDNTYAKNAAKGGFEDTTKTIGKNKEQDKAKLGQYSAEQRAKFEVDRDTARKNVGRAGETEDVDALRGLRNDLEQNIGAARVTGATLGTDEGAKGELSRRTQDAGRFEAATNALKSILESAMSGSVKAAAVKAVVDNAGLSQEEKDKVDQMYGNVYAEQAAL